MGGGGGGEGKCNARVPGRRTCPDARHPDENSVYTIYITSPP